jgi:hypothetical protein
MKATYHVVCEGVFRNSDFDEIKPKKQQDLLDSLNRNINDICEYIDDNSYAIESITAIKVIGSSVKYEIVFDTPKNPYQTQLDDFAAEISGQFSDGWGEGFEQYPFFGEEDSGKELYYSPWKEDHKLYKLVKVTK